MPAEVNLKDVIQALAHFRGRAGNLRKIRLGEGFERNQHLCVRHLQYSADLLGVDQWIDRARDAGDLGSKDGDRGFGGIRQQERHDIILPDPQRPEQVCGLGRLVVNLRPGQCLRLGLGIREQLKGQRVVRAMPFLGLRQQLVDRVRRPAAVPRHFEFNSFLVGSCRQLDHQMLPLLRLPSSVPEDWIKWGSVARLNAVGPRPGLNCISAKRAYSPPSATSSS